MQKPSENGIISPVEGVKIMKKGVIYTIIGILLLIFVIGPLLKFLLGYVLVLTSLASALAALLIPIVVVILIIVLIVKLVSKSKKYV